MKSYIVIILFLVVNQLTAQIPILNTSWYLTQIEENNQIDMSITNTNTNVPRPIIGDPNANARDSNRFIEKGDYLKLQTMEIGYQIPVPTDFYIQKAKVYINGQNLLTLTKYKGYDPDFNGNDGLFSRGYDAGSFPNPRTLSLGLEVTF